MKIGVHIQQHTDKTILPAYRHIERHAEQHSNIHIDNDLTRFNVHFVEPSGTYTEMYNDLLEHGKISEKGLKDGATKIETALIDIKSAYFCNNYELAKEIYGKATQRFIDLMGEENILSAVMHSDEMYTDEKTGQQYIHFHVHIAYIPTAHKLKRFSRATAKKDPSLYERDSEGEIIYVEEYNRKKKQTERLPLTKIKEEYNQVSHSNCYKERLGDNSYSKLQDIIAESVKEYGLERGEPQATRAELTTNEYTAQRQRENITFLEEELQKAQQRLQDLKRSAELEAEELIKEQTPEGVELIEWALNHLKGFYKRILEICEREYNKYIKRRQGDYMSLAEQIDNATAEINRHAEESAQKEDKQKQGNGNDENEHR